MDKGRIWPLRLHWLGRLLLGLLALIFLNLLPALSQEPPKVETKKPWTGKLADGRVINQADLEQILQASFKEGKHVNLPEAKLSMANLREADLVGADLRGAWLIRANMRRTWINYANLSGANLLEADLSEADMIGANISAAKLYRADLSGAFIKETNLRGTDLRAANLSAARLFQADLSGANLSGANLSKALFEPKLGTVSNVTLLLSIRGLPSLRYEFSSHGLVELREAYKKAGMLEPERQVTFALNHTRREKLWKEGGFLGKLESLFNLVCFEWTCQYGMNPGRPLEILGLGLFLFTPIYLLALGNRDRRDRQTGIWLVRPPDRIIGGGSKARPFKLTGHTPFRPLPPGRWARLKVRLHRGLRCVRLAFYFSLLSAFNLGWRELNVGNWISRLQKNEYHLRATGWVRTVAGVQSLLSVYLLALWVLTYFGRPFG